MGKITEKKTPDKKLKPAALENGFAHSSALLGK